MGERLLVIVDADTLAGWRRPTASLAQLHHAVRDLRAQEPDATVAVVGDPSLRWALDDTEREQLDEDVRTGAVAFAPAGAIGGHVGFIAKVAEKASAQGWSPVTISDRAIPGATFGRARRDGARWVFDLEGVPAPTITAAPSAHRRRPRPPKPGGRHA
jgi:hypothetical protein